VKCIKLLPIATWWKLRHATFSGSTLFTALVGSNIDSFEPIQTPLRRNIRHLLNHGLQPAPAPPPATTSLTASHRLHPAQLDREVTFRTSFTASGWGARALSLDEVGIAFGLPMWLRPSRLALGDFPVVPVQILDVFLWALVPISGVHQPITPPLPGAEQPAETRTWLSTVGRYLAHSWVDASIVTDKAVKRENADVPSQLWDTHCELIVPGIAHFLPQIRSWLLVKVGHCMMKEFCAFLRVQHGPDWAETLMASRCVAAWDCLSGQKRKRGGAPRL
jgi:hypothetical protein